MTPPRISLRDRVVLASLTGIVIGIFGWLILHPAPPDPIVKGHPVSWWCRKEAFDLPRPDTEDYRAAGPRAVLGLAYIAEHGNMGYRREPTTWIGRQLNSLLIDVRIRLFGGQEFRQESKEAVFAFHRLGELRQDAAPAIPTLVRIIERSDGRDFSKDERARSAVWVLALIGPPALSEQLRLIDTRPPEIRHLLIQYLAIYTDTQILTEPERARFLDALISAATEPDEEARVCAILALSRFCERHGFRPEMRPAIPAMVDELIDLRRTRLSSIGVVEPGERPSAVLQFASAYKKEASAAIPRLLDNLGDSNPEIVSTAATALSLIDATDPRIIARMRGLLSSPHPESQKIARTYLQKLGVLPADPADHP